MADLNGDGVDEIIVFAKGATEKPLQILIFTQDQDGKVRTMATIGSNGLAFEQVEYVDFDDHPGCELVVGIRVSDQVQRSVAVYTFRNDDAELMLLNGYTKFITCDLNENGLSELMVFRQGEVETQRAMVVLYQTDHGQIERSLEQSLSQNAGDIRRIMQGKLQSGKSAVYVASASDNTAMVTDVLTLQDDRFINLTFSGEVDTSIPALRNFYVYPDDINEDGVLEIPAALLMKSLSPWEGQLSNYFLRWYSLDENGWEYDKMITFHNFMGGWYLELQDSWASRITVQQGNGVFYFYLWDESYQTAEALFTVYVFTGSNRDEEAVKDGRFALYRSEGIAYAASLEELSTVYDITEDYLIECFRLIRQDWQTGET